ncbi:hypothetical protein [Pedobacter nyackensis]|uniref:hypothetical protein n=1 Tax=Pedobacter nyackensis TaxID=475255 RepID=UPI002931AE85|nr:hypothetical protein [Pedobacter nyackensis]
MKNKLSLSSLVVFLCLFFISSCKKDSLDPADQSIHQLSKEEITFKWGQAQNGRWMPYLLGEIKKEHPEAKAEEIFLLLGSYLKPVNDAIAYYSENSKIDLVITADDHKKWLQKYYFENYEKINNSLALRKDMDKLYEQYKRMSLEKISSARKILFGKIQGTRDGKRLMELGGDLEEVQIVGECYVPRGLYYWIEQYYGVMYLQLIRNGASPSWVPSYPLIQKTWKGDMCEGRYNRFRDAVWDLVNAFGGGCTDKAYLAMNAIEEYHACIPENGSSPADPYGPGSGSGGSNGTGNSSTHYSESEAIYLINNLYDPITQDGIQLYLIANYKGAKMLDLSKFSQAANAFVVEDYTLTPHYNSSGTLLFYTATRLNSTNGIEFLVEASQLGAFRENVDYYRASADLVYMNGIPTPAMIKMMSGDHASGLLDLWVDAIQSPEYWMYLANLYAITPNTASTLSKVTDALEMPVNRTLTPAGLGSTGRIAAENLVEEMAMRAVMDNPTIGIRIANMPPLSDPRWLGWIKMEFKIKTVNGVDAIVHYVAKYQNGVIKAVDDFKFK